MKNENTKYNPRLKCEDCGKPIKGHALCPTCAKKFGDALNKSKNKRMIVKGGF